MCALVTQRTGASGVPSQFDVINRVRLSSMPLEALRAHLRATRGTSDAVGPDWSAVLRLVDFVGVNTLERAAVLLAPCIRAEAPAGTAEFVTVYASKGLGYPWVVVADDWAHGDADKSARECHLAATRPECGLALPRTLHTRLTRAT
ncbi:hypothetical protein M885DRAFT_625976 [Pelagophyceae sp. CCMP2097]|nr:hypothetical protein M885DRAFT_625976 [Pelagophyceae sp. CCMP2097]